MKQIIVIGTGPGREAWLNDCLESLRDCPVPVRPVHSRDFELSVIGSVRDAEEFIFLPDSTEVLDVNRLCAKCFGTPLAVSLAQTPEPFGMYLGKYRTAHVQHISVPHVANKLDAVLYETVWTRQYRALAPFLQVGDLPHSDVFVRRHGRLNMVVENHLLRRYKGSWDTATMYAEHERVEASR